MKAIVIGGGVLALGLIGWLTLSGSSTAVTATPISSGFNYERASIVERQEWLSKHADPMAKLFDRSLPKGNSAQPHMAVTGWAVDARRRAIEVRVEVKGQYGIDKRAVPAARRAMVDRICPSYASSALGQNKVHLHHSFFGQDGREALSFVISPLSCRAFM
jgi:hypothetical protein